MIGQDAVDHGAGVPRRRRLRRRRPDQARRRRPRWCRAVGRARSPASRSCSPPTARSSTDFDALPPRPDGLAHPRHGRRAHPDRAGREGLRRTSRPRKAAGKLPARASDFTLDDFLEQMQAVRKMGSMSKILGMLPGMGADPRPARELRRARDRPRSQAIIQSMTPAERADPKILNGSRRAAHRQGLGPPGQRRQPARRPVLRGPQDDEVRWPRAAACPGCRACPAWPVAASARKAKQQAKKGKGKRVSGNPAKAAQQAAAAEGEGRRRRPTRSARPPATRSTTRRPPPRSTCPRTSPSS